MATSASALAAALTEQMHESAGSCMTRFITAAGLTEMCGQPGGRSERNCKNGHRRQRITCPAHVVGPHFCTDCWEELGYQVACILRTEVA